MSNDELRAAAVEYCNAQHSSGRCVFDYDDVIRAFLAGAVWRLVNEEAAAKYRAELLAGDGKPEGTIEALQMCARMLNTYAKDLFPANEHGQVYFARAIMESVADEITAFVAEKYQEGGGSSAIVQADGTIKLRGAAVIQEQ